MEKYWYLPWRLITKKKMWKRKETVESVEKGLTGTHEQGGGGNNRQGKGYFHVYGYKFSL